MYIQIFFGVVMLLAAVLLGVAAFRILIHMRIRRILLAMDREEIGVAYFERKELSVLQYELAVMKKRSVVLDIEIKKESGLVELYIAE